MVVKKRESLSASVQKELQNSLMDGEYQVGEYLPGEQTLAEQYNVSRTTMRDAVGALVEKGFLERHQGKGVRVIDKSQSVVVDSLRMMILRGNYNLSEFVETRRLIETQIAYLAASRATDEQIDGLRKLISQMISCDNIKNYAYYDISFHMKLAEAAKNRVLLSIMTAMRPILEQIVQHVVVSDGRVEKDAHFHENILKGLEERDPNIARKCMEKHLLASEAMIRKSFDKQVSDVVS